MRAKTAPLIAFVLFLSPEGCSTAFRIPAPVPASLYEYDIPAPAQKVWDASLAALGALGFTTAEADQARGVLVSEFSSLDGNSERHRTSGVARFAIERDVYSDGGARLRVALAPERKDATRVRVAADLRGKLVQRGEIQPTASGDPPREPGSGAAASAELQSKDGDWTALTSNGVLEDDFLAALYTRLQLH